MADALPPDAAAQIEQLKSFKQDVELAVRTKAKGGASQPVTLEELRGWIARALESNTDAPIMPLAGGPGEGTGYLQPKNRDAVLKELKARVDGRLAELEKTPAAASVTAKAWLTSTLVELAQKRAVVEVKSGATRPASLDEVKQWLGEEPPPATKKRD